MRVALISLAGDWPAIAGKSLAERQAEFALAAGAERIAAVGDGAGAPAIALRHAVERAGAKFQAIRDCQGLLGAARADDDLLVLSPGLLPDAGSAIELLARPAVLILPANAGAAAGFERIDLQRAWAGALSVAGAQVERLAGLPPDTEPAAALLRVALQAGSREHALPEALLADGSWAMLREGADSEALSRDWLRRHVAPADRFSLSGRLAGALVRRAGVALLRAPHAAFAARAGAWLGLVLGAILAWWDLPSLGLGLIALAVVAAELAADLRSLEGPIHAAAPGIEAAEATRWLIDLALVAALAGAIDGTWLHRLFPPLALVAALRTGRVAGSGDVVALLRERALVAFVLVVAAFLDLAEPATMALALVATALNLRKIGPPSG